MNHLLDRLTAALAPQYQVIQEVAAGGMGVVYLALDPALRRRVAVKVLRPELASAAQAERFLREARILAKLSHPNVVTVYAAGEAAGLFYFVMEYAEGESLATRIGRGPMAEAEVLALADGLLNGLAAIHAAGIVHRDLKPANILLRADRAMIADFGIALADATTTDVAAALPNAGTAPYMAPEQRQGLPATPRSDLYAAALVLYEAATGRRWDPGAAADWGGVPDRLRPALGRALETDPAARWPSAGAMLAAMAAPGRARWIGVTGIAAVLVGAALRLIRPEQAVRPFQIYLESAPGALPLADSVRDALAGQLGSNPDFWITTVSDSATITIRPTVERADSTLRLVATISGPRLNEPVTVGTPKAGLHQWPALVDSLTDGIVNSLYLGAANFDPWLPRAALPQAPAAVRAWFRGERAYSDARWDDALKLYTQAVAADSTCLICLYRLNDVNRWLNRGEADELTWRLAAHLDRFPEHYQALIRAYAAPEQERYDSLKAAAERFPDFAIGWMAVGDEGFHRGALRGRPRSEAEEALNRAALLKPGFAPAWEHLAWIFLETGDSVLATAAIDSLNRAPATAGFSAALHQALRLGYAWRFRSEAEAIAATDTTLADPRLASLADLSAGARILMTMGAPNGAVYLGRRFEAETDRVGLPRGGLWGQFFGYSALGRFGAADSAATRLHAIDPAPETELFLVEWAVVRAVLWGDPPAAEAVTRLTDAAATAPAEALRKRAQWMLAQLDSANPAPHHFDPEAETLLGAMRGARAGGFAAALEATDSLHPLVPGPPADPFLPLLLRWSRAGWLERLGRAADAARELTSYQHLQLDKAPTGKPQAGEVDWAMAPLLERRRATLLAVAATAPAERCRALGEVVRLWRGGDAGPRAAAEAARRTLESDCRPR